MSVTNVWIYQDKINNNYLRGPLVLRNIQISMSIQAKDTANMLYIMMASITLRGIKTQSIISMDQEKNNKVYRANPKTAISYIYYHKVTF